MDTLDGIVYLSVGGWGWGYVGINLFLSLHTPRRIWMWGPNKNLSGRIWVEMGVSTNAVGLTSFPQCVDTGGGWQAGKGGAESPMFSTETHGFLLSLCDPWFVRCLLLQGCSKPSFFPIECGGPTIVIVVSSWLWENHGIAIPFGWWIQSQSMYLPEPVSCKWTRIIRISPW